MAPFIFRCPTTGFRVQDYASEQTSDDHNSYEAVTCLACNQLHLVNPATGKVLGEDDE